MGKLSLFILLIFGNNFSFGQFQNESLKIRDEFRNGLISPEIANSKWEKLQKTDFTSPFSIEIYGWRAYTFINKNNIDEAFKLLNEGLIKSNSLKNDSLKFKFLSDLAFVAKSSGDFTKANFYFENANNLIKEKKVLLKQIPQYIWAFYSNFGKAKQEIGDYKESIFYFQTAKKIAETNKLYNFLPTVLGNIATSYLAMGNNKQAMDNLLQSLKYFAFFNQIAEKYLKIAQINKSESDWPQMEENLKQATLNLNKSAMKKAGSVFPDIEIGISNAFGDFYLGTKNYDSAIKKFNESIEIAEKYNYSNNISKYLIATYKSISISQTAQQKYPLAFQNLQKALQYNSTNFKSDNIAENPKIESIKYKNDAIEIFKEKIIVLLGIYKKEGKAIYLDYALGTANVVHELINYQRNSFQLEGSKLFLSEQAHAIYGLGIEAAFEKYRLTKNQKYLELAFKYSENNKSVVLFESVKGSKASTYNGVPQLLIDQEYSAIKNMAIFENQLYKDQKNENLWRKKLIDVTDELAKLKLKFKKEYPAYYNFKYNSETISIAETQAKLSEYQSVIEYFVHNNKLFTFLITKKSSQLFSQNIDENFKENIANFKNYLITKSISSGYQKLSFSLYNLLFNAQMLAILERQKVENLKIIGDGVINFIPIECLLTRQTKSLKEANIYLIEKYTVGYCPSATMNWKNVKAKETAWFPETYVGFAPSYKKEIDLPDNQTNVSNLANEFSGKSFLLSEANKENFNEYSAKNSKIFHLSMHGGASATDAMESYLAFEKDSFFVHDIYTKNIPTDLAILDACETGMGILNNGEGVLNLARAFLHAGSQAVAMSLWKLSSSPETSLIIKDFAIAVANGEAKDNALAKAKINYLNKNRNNLVLGHPFYWSPLIIIGNAAPIEPSYLRYWLILLFALLAYGYSSYQKN